MTAASFATTIGAFAVGFRPPVFMPDIRMLEYWFAFLVWGGMLSWAAAFARRFFGADSSTRSALMRRPLFSILFATCVAFLSPFVTPLSPESQGDLRTTRYVTPFTMGSGYWLHEIPGAPTATDNWLIKTAEETSFAVTQRQFIFSGDKSEGTIPVVFLLGTDAIGRDVFSRILYGARTSLIIAGIACLVTAFLSALIGFLCGLGGKVTDTLLMRCADVMLALPPILLMIAVVAFVGTSNVVLIAVLGLFSWMASARIIRAETLRVREAEFVQAARLLGVPFGTIVVRHIFPNVLPVVVTGTLLQFAGIMIGESTLSFLGIGVQPPTPSLGIMLSESLSAIRTAWWAGVFPGIALTTLVAMMHHAAYDVERRWTR